MIDVVLEFAPGMRHLRKSMPCNTVNLTFSLIPKSPPHFR